MKKTQSFLILWLCIKKIMEAFKSAEEVKEKSSMFNKILNGQTSEEILIEIRVSKNNENWKIDTGFMFPKQEIKNDAQYKTDDQKTVWMFTHYGFSQSRILKMF